MYVGGPPLTAGELKKAILYAAGASNAGKGDAPRSTACVLGNHSACTDGDACGCQCHNEQ